MIIFKKFILEIKVGQINSDNTRQR